ncbi:hypothetical protein [Streptomyces phaeochromogenes]|uniref:hypothetical protein n=1 Tax=Streptomyces phaeochromogenes TaxID=1923 RepID=UPI0038648593|nr:hypothetical protein OG478_01005 [Streptomyces phaeochromogenes]WSW11679.1 hypothetical protein OG277_00750 [Streptomyces phaeochromogenes]
MSKGHLRKKVPLTASDKHLTAAIPATARAGLARDPDIKARIAELEEKIAKDH